MHSLGREVRFSINPFEGDDSEGFNSYASKPCGAGLCLYFGLWVELTGTVDDDTGFVVNVTEIDRMVRQFVVPIFDDYIKQHFRRGEIVWLAGLCDLLKRTWGVLGDKFSPAGLTKLTLELNPFRKMTIESEDWEVFYFSEKFEFAAMHTLWNDKFSQERNLELFGKCANPAGHGHNYVLEVTVKRDIEADETGWIADFERVVDQQFISLVDHKNLNVDVPEFGRKNPTVENIAAFAWDRLVAQFGPAGGKTGDCPLFSVTVWETEKTYCTYCGQERSAHQA